MDRGKTFSHQVPYQLAGNDGMGALTGRHGRSSSGARPLARSSQSRSRSRIRYCRPVPVRRGLRRAAQPGWHAQDRRVHLYTAATAHPMGQSLSVLSSSSQRDACACAADGRVRRQRRQQRGHARRDAVVTQTHAEMGWACSLPLPERQQLRPEGCSCTAPRNGTQHQCSTTAHTILCLCVVYIEPYTHTRMHGSLQGQGRKRYSLQLAYCMLQPSVSS